MVRLKNPNVLFTNIFYDIHSFDRHRLVFAIVNNSSQQFIGIMIMKLLILWKSDE